MEAVTVVGVRVSEHFGHVPDVVVTTERVETDFADVSNVVLVVEIVGPPRREAIASRSPPSWQRPACPRIGESSSIADGPVIYCHRSNGAAYSTVVTMMPGHRTSVLVAGTISVAFDPADLHKPRR
jgi:hypothetical protein